jgi:hypothetical protein
MMPYDPRAWFWVVADDETRAFSSAASAYVDAKDEAYQAWLAKGGLPTKIASEAELWEVLAKHAPDKMPADSAAQEVRKILALDKVDLVALQVAFNHENRVRALEGKQAITLAQFKTAVKALL